MKKIFVVLVVCVLIVIVVFFVTRNKKSFGLNDAESIKNFDVWGALEYNANLDNICLDAENSERIITYCKKDEWLKTISEDGIIMLVNDDTVWVYNTNEKTGEIFSKGENLNINFIYDTYCNDILDNKVLLNYKVELKKVDGKEYSQVSFFDKNNIIEVSECWFDLNTKLLVKFNTVTFKNIKLDVLEDKDMSVPNDIIFKKAD